MLRQGKNAVQQLRCNGQKCGEKRYYVAVAQRPKFNLDRNKISDALNFQNRVKGISFA